jgi:chromosome segregation and condensation protein ScpB
MLVILDSLAQRYHSLPSELLRTADTLDLRTMLVAQAWTHRQSESDTKPARPELTQDQMKAMIERTRQKNHDSN